MPDTREYPRLLKKGEVLRPILDRVISPRLIIVSRDITINAAKQWFAGMDVSGNAVTRLAGAWEPADASEIIDFHLRFKGGL